MVAAAALADPGGEGGYGEELQLQLLELQEGGRAEHKWDEAGCR